MWQHWRRHSALETYVTRVVTLPPVPIKMFDINTIFEKFPKQIENDPGENKINESGLFCFCAKTSKKAKIKERFLLILT